MLSLLFWHAVTLITGIIIGKKFLPSFFFKKDKLEIEFNTKKGQRDKKTYKYPWVS